MKISIGPNENLNKEKFINKFSDNLNHSQVATGGLLLKKSEVLDIGMMGTTQFMKIKVFSFRTKDNCVRPWATRSAT